MARLLTCVALILLIQGISEQPRAGCGVENERIAKVTVITCDDPTENVMTRIWELQAETPDEFNRWLKNLKLDSPSAYKDWLLGRNPGVIIGVKVLRSRELDFLRQQEDPNAPLARAWDESPQPRFYFWRSGSCDRLREEGGTRLLYLPMRCCDTIPASDPECLLNIQPTADLPKWIIEAGYHE